MQVHSRSLDVDLQHNEDSAERTVTYVSLRYGSSSYEKSTRKYLKC